MSDISRLLTLVEEHLPLGKDEWERLTDAYNATRTRNCVERDMDSLRRKFKALYGVRKPTGSAEMPPHIQRSKLLKIAIDDKANVVEMDDEADQDGEERKEEGDTELFVEPDFSFEPFYEDEEGPREERVGSDAPSMNQFGDDSQTSSTMCVTEAPLALQPPAPENVSCNLDLQLGTQGLEAFAPIPKTVTQSEAPAPRQLRSAGLKPPRKTNIVRVASTDVTPSPSAPRGVKVPAARGFQPGSRDEEEAFRHITLHSSSNRLGGVDLYRFRDSVGSKRVRDGEDTAEAEASFAKAKRIRAVKTTTALKQKLAELERAGSNVAGSAFEMMLMFREDNERKLEARRLEEEQRRRDDAAAKEARLIAEKTEAAERRRQDKLEMEERVRRDKEDARARTQELLLLIGAVMKKD